jgi:hypothetical protein
MAMAFRMIARLAVLALLVSSHAFAQGNQADVEFKRGKELMAQGKYAEACTAFDKSQALDPTVSVMLNQANCREKNGQLATARELFLAAAMQTNRASDAKNIQFHNVAVDRAAKLADRVSSLTIDVPQASRVLGLVIKRNGTAVEPVMWNTAALLDGGSYVIEASAPDHKPFTTTVALATEKDRQTVTVALEANPKPVVTPPDQTQPDTTKPDTTRPDTTKPDTIKLDTTTPGTTKPDVVVVQPPRRSRVLPMVVGALGVALIATNVTFLVIAGSTYDEAKLEGNDARQTELWNSANDQRYVAEITGLAGVATIGVAVYLYIRSRDDGSPRVQPVVGADRAALVVTGRF